MENIKFIKMITDYIERDRQIIGNCIYYRLECGNRIKLWCTEGGVKAEVINKINGAIDGISLPFANYFKPTQCSLDAPKWTQHIEGGKWYFSDVYKHVLPTDEDYHNLANAIAAYMKLFE